MANKEIITGYKKIKIRYQKLISKAAKKHNWDTARFMNTIAGLYNRKDRETEKYFERGRKHGTDY